LFILPELQFLLGLLRKLLLSGFPLLGFSSPGFDELWMVPCWLAIESFCIPGRPKFVETLLQALLQFFWYSPGGLGLGDELQVKSINDSSFARVQSSLISRLSRPGYSHCYE
jgi:hypothetical protein